MSDDKPKSWIQGRFAMVPIAWLKLSGRELRVAAAISSFASKSGEAFPSYAKLRALTGIHERDLRRIIPELCKKILMDVESQPGRANTYLLSAEGVFDGDMDLDLKNYKSTATGDELDAEVPF